MNELIFNNQETIVISSLLGALLAWILEYTPGLSSWFNSQKHETKIFVSVVMMIGLSVLALALSCNGLLPYSCPDNDAVLTLIGSVVVGWFTSQATHQLTKSKKE